MPLRIDLGGIFFFFKNFLKNNFEILIIKSCSDGRLEKYFCQKYSNKLILKEEVRRFPLKCYFFCIMYGHTFCDKCTTRLQGLQKLLETGNMLLNESTFLRFPSSLMVTLSEWSSIFFLHFNI